MFQRDLFAIFLNAEFNVFKETSRALAGDPKQKTVVNGRTQFATGIQKAVNLKSPQMHTICTILLAEEAEEEQKRFHVKLRAFFVGVFHL
jgi:hypothetical protein